jgi:hypothetical protein
MRLIEKSKLDIKNPGWELGFYIGMREHGFTGSTTSGC